MPFRNRRLLTETIAYAASQVKSIDLPREYYLHGCHLHMTGVVTHTDVTQTPVPFSLSPATLIDKIEVIADGKTVLKSFSGQQLYLLNQIWGKVAGLRTAPGVTAAASTFALYLYVPFSIPRSLNSIDTLLDPRVYTSLQLRITWANAMLGLFSTLPTTGTITTDPTITVNPDQSFGKELSMRNLFMQWAEQHLIAATSSRMAIDVAGGHMFRGLTLITERVAAGAIGDPANNILNSFEIRYGQNLIWETNRALLQAAEAYGSELATAPTGVFKVDFTEAGMKEGLLTEMLDARQWSKFRIWCDVTKTSGTEYIYVIPDQVVIRRGVGEAAI